MQPTLDLTMEEDGASISMVNYSPILGNMDYDLMDLFLDEEGCWLQTDDVGQSSSSSDALMSYYPPPHPGSNNPSLQANSIKLTSTTTLNHFQGQQQQQQQQQQQEEMERWDLPDSTPPPVFRQNTSSEDLNPRPQDYNAFQIVKSPGKGNGNDLNRIWIAPPEFNRGGGPSTSVEDRLMRAIWYFKELNRDRNILIQIWLPVRRGTKSYLTTAEQPYYLDPASTTHLINYRYVSEKCQFSTDKKEPKESPGMPCRVFMGKVPEWTPDVQFFRQDEYQRVGYARKYGVRGAISLPIFERGSGNCLGVVEIVTTRQKVTYHPEVESLCKALEAVDLRSSDITSSSKEKIIVSEAYEAAVLPNILSILRTVCDEHDLPLAQTWALYGEDWGGCQCHSEKKSYCALTVDSACYVRDPKIRGFHEACSEHHLLRGQGVVGKAFMSNQPCFATDITSFSKADYPLSHHAKMFELRGAVAIHVKTTCSSGESLHYVLEFFLPSSYNEDATLTLFHCRVVESLSKSIQQSYPNLCFPTLEDLMQQPLLSDKEIEIPSSSSDGELGTSRDSNKMKADQKVAASLFREDKHKLREEVGLMMDWGDADEELPLGSVFTDDEQNSGHKGYAEGGGDASFWDDQHASGARKTGERKKTKAQKSISLQELRQHFAGSLKDAAKEIGVCPTTLKRICRQHGITRWPSRKIKKVGHSLKKLQKVIDSVKGAEGSIQLTNFYNRFPELNSSNLSCTNTSSSYTKMNADANNLSSQAEGDIFHSGANTSKPQSPSNLTSSSSHSHSLSCGAKTSTPSPMGNTPAENPSALLKRINEAAEAPPLQLEKSQSKKSEGDNPSMECVMPCLPTSTGFVTRRGGGALKVKAALGEDKIRFSITGNMGFRDLQQEIAIRFGIDDVNNAHIKYLDDEKEWVLLTCDADLDECIDVQSSSGSHMIKLSVHRIYPPRSGS